LAEIIATSFMAPFEYIIGAFGFLADIIGALGQFLSGDFAGAWETLSSGFMDFIDTIIAPFKSIFDMLYNGFAKLWNGLADSWIGESLGLGKMEERKSEPAGVSAKPQASITAETQQKAVEAANKPVVVASTANTKINEKINKAQEDVLKESKFSGNIQNEMVSLLAANAILLEELVHNTAGDRPIALDGKKVNTTLLSSTRRNYSLART
jgi:hypothetical protein